MTILISNAAFECLFDEPPHLTKLYAYLAKHMDYETSVCGLERRISYQSICELMSVSSYAGRKAEAFSRTKVQTALRRLETIGLIVNMGKCVYLLPKERAEKTAQMRLLQGYCRDTAKNSTQVTERKKKSASSLLLSKLEVTAPLINQSINQSTTENADGKFAMSSDWLPSDSFKDQAKMVMIDVSEGGQHWQLYNQALVDLRMHWQSEKGASERRNQFGWEKALLGTLTRMKNNPVSNGVKSYEKGKQQFGRAGASDAERNAAAARRWAQENEL